MSAETYLCLRIPEFAAQAMLRFRAELRRAPAAVLAGDAPQETVCAMNGLAARAGVRHGMSRAELASFAAVAVLRRSLVEERGAKAALLELAGTFTPRVEEQTEPDGAVAVVLDMSGTGRIFGSAQAAARRILQAVRALGFSARAGVSANQMCAVCLARAAGGQALVVAKGDEARTLAGMPLTVLMPTEAQRETLGMWGLRTVGELAVLPEAQLVARLGQDGRRLQMLALGEHPHLMVPVEAAFCLEERMEFDAPVEQLESLMFVLGAMVGQVMLRAGDRALALACVTVRMLLDGGGEHLRSIRPALPTLDRAMVLKLLHLDFQAHPPGAGVVGLALAAEVGHRGKVQIGLFSPQLPEAMRLDVTLARIAALVGEENVGRARRLDSHRPESFVVERFVVGVGRDGAERTPGAGKGKPQQIPFGNDNKKNDRKKQTPFGNDNKIANNESIAVRVMRPPLRVEVQGKGRGLQGFHLAGAWYRVTQIFGPWRRSGEWWTGTVWSREEWDVRAETQAGSCLLCLLAHDLLRGQWQIVATYD